jgi:hypothetical protein
LSSYCKISLQSFTIVYKREKKEKNMTARSYIVEEGNRLNNYAIEPKIYVDETQKFGFTEYAEKLNGRLAMIGFVSLIALEVLTGHGLVGWLSSL